MRSLKILLVLVLCSTSIESTRRVLARSCKYLIGRMITEMTSIKGEIGNLQENVRDLTTEVHELKVANTALQMQVNDLEENVKEEGKLARTLGRTLKQKHPQPLWK